MNPLSSPPYLETTEVRARTVSAAASLDFLLNEAVICKRENDALSLSAIAQAAAPSWAALLKTTIHFPTAYYPYDAAERNNASEEAKTKLDQIDLAFRELDVIIPEVVQKRSRL